MIGGRIIIALFPHFTESPQRSNELVRIIEQICMPNDCRTCPLADLHLWLDVANKCYPEVSLNSCSCPGLLSIWSQPNSVSQLLESVLVFPPHHHHFILGIKKFRLGNIKLILKSQHCRICSVRDEQSLGTCVHLRRGRGERTIA